VIAPPLPKEEKNGYSAATNIKQTTLLATSSGNELEIVTNKENFKKGRFMGDWLHLGRS